MKINRLFIYFISLLAVALPLSAQTNEFTYQGRLFDGGIAAMGTYDFEFRLFAVENGGSPLAAQQRPAITVSNGVFTVSLDFGVLFTGEARFLEIAVKPAGSPDPFTVLSPRHRITSAPYAIKSLAADAATDSAQLGGMTADQYVLTGDPRLSDARDPLPGSSNYIQNTNSPQAASNFNITGDGTAGGTLSGNIVNAGTQYNIGGDRVLSVGGELNVFAGVGAGANNTTGHSNSFFGSSAGLSNTGGNSNSFFGRSAGLSNTTGVGNSFFGSSAGLSNTTGIGNSFFGHLAGDANTTGSSNSFFGRLAGQNSTGVGNSFFGSSAGDANTTGDSNSFFGVSAGSFNTTGDSNSFFGRFAGSFNTTGINNTMVGANTNVGTNNLTFATAIGAGAVATLSNSIYLGRANGSDTVRVPGNLTLTGAASLNGNLVVAGGATILFNSPVSVTSLGSAGATAICRNASNQLSTCSSSLRYKTNVTRFGLGLDLVRQLRPITFDWKEGGMHDLGLGAEDVAAIEPLLVTYNKDGQVEGVKYDRLGLVLLNAVKEQQEQIERQQRQIEELMRIVCTQSPALEICKGK